MPRSTASANATPLHKFAIRMAAILVPVVLAGGCRQPGMTGASATPITTLPGQVAPSAGPAFPLGPFGSGVRVPPPATGSFGNPGGVIATPGYAPSASIGNGFQGNAGFQGNTGFQGNDFPANPLDPSTPNIQQTSYVETASPRSIRSGGMPVIDLTNGAFPPGYAAQPGYSAPANEPPPMIQPYQPLPIAPPVFVPIAASQMSTSPENSQTFGAGPVVNGNSSSGGWNLSTPQSSNVIAGNPPPPAKTAIAPSGELQWQRVR